jgi:hypothetical protein
MSPFLALIRDRLSTIATQAATSADALADGACLDLDAHALADLLFSLDALAARVGRICDRLASALDPARIAG